MSCANTADHSLVVLIGPSRLASRWPAFITTIVAIHDAFEKRWKCDALRARNIV